MKNITSVIDLSPGQPWDGEGDKSVREVFKGERRQLLEVRLRNGQVLARHTAAEPITVLCLSGRGTFRAGPELEDAQVMTAGTLLTLESNILHELTAEPEIQILVSKFRQ